MKKLTSLALLFIIAFQVSAQVAGGTYEKLAKLYSEGKYESCLVKADNYTYREDYSKDAEPYLYVSMSLYQISLSSDPEILEDYPDALIQSIKYAGKFVKKDKDDALYTINIDYIDLLKGLQRNYIKEEFNNGNYRKAISASKIYDNLNREDDPLVACYIALNELLLDNNQWINNFDAALTNINADIKAKNLKIDKIFKSSLIDAFLKSTEQLVKANKNAEAKKVIALAKDIFPSDGYIKMQYNMLFGN